MEWYAASATDNPANSINCSNENPGWDMSSWSNAYAAEDVRYPISNSCWNDSDDFDAENDVADVNVDDVDVIFGRLVLKWFWFEWECEIVETRSFAADAKVRLELCKERVVNAVTPDVNPRNAKWRDEDSIDR